MPKVFVTKADGEKELFDPSKLELSLEQAGASSTARAKITANIIHWMHPKTTTEDIYHHAFEMLKNDEPTPVAARYSIKRAVFALGPSGFPFEQFLAEVLKAHGWKARTSVELLGRCASHEVDVLAEKDGKRVGIEAKFHNDASGKTDIKDALYVYARYDDLRNSPDPHAKVDEGWLVTNTRFTHNAIRYARCVNLSLLSWEYPRDKGLFYMIEEAKVHPLTCLTTLSDVEKRRLLDQRIVLCKSVQAPHILREFGVRAEKIDAVLHEAKQLCSV
ncbi:MAG: hypothetical protein RIQ56_522 [Candidatus Parcubacteria bacterium]|jgi:hypothetical protein